MPYANNIIPTSKFNDASNKILSLYPLPNAGDLTTVHDANYIDNRDNGYNSNQYDIRIDHYLTSKQSIYGRWTWLNTDTMNPTQLLLPSVKKLERNRMFVVSHNYTILPNLLNEARFGFTNFDSTNGMDFDGPAFADSLGLVGLGPKYPFNGLPEINFNNLESENIDRVDGFSKSHMLPGHRQPDLDAWTPHDEIRSRHPQDARRIGSRIHRSEQLRQFRFHRQFHGSAVR